MKLISTVQLILATLLAVCWSSLPADDLPEAFDLREVDGEDYVTSIKSQQGGTCWTHGAMAAIEGNLLMTGTWEYNGEDGEPNLAEYHLDWWNGFNEHYNGDLDPPSGGGLTVHMGGDYMVTSAYLTRGDGAVRDVDGQSFDTPPEYQDPGFHYYYPRHIEWLTAGESLETISDIKARLMEEGVIGTCLCSSGEFINDEFIHYQPPESPYDPNHAVAIVGWDDNLVTQAPLPGAWLCKNSWGEGWGLDGFFWISYYDKWCGQQPEMGAVSFREVERLAWDHVYYHDYHGKRDRMPSSSAGFNAFEAVCDQKIEAVSVFTCVDDVSYTIRIYGAFDGESLGNQLCEESGFFDHGGYHVVDISDIVFLEQGDSFYVWLEVDQGGLAYDRTSDVPVLLGAQYRTIVESTASPGESYYRDGSDWADLYYWSGNPYPGTGNLCIKAMAVNYGLAVEPETDVVFSGPEGGPFSPSTHLLQLENNGFGNLSYDVSPYPAVSWLTLYGPASGSLAPDETVDLWLEVNPNADTLQPGAYTAQLNVLNTTDHYGDTVLPIVVLAGDPERFYERDMSEDPGWSCEGDWAWGVPEGLGGQHGNPDPASGYTGRDVMGYNLRGDYTDYMPPLYLTTGPIDCSDFYLVSLCFQRWLNVQERGFDEATLRVSSDGESWTDIWQNPSGWPSMTDSAWVQVSYDISEIADGEPEVYIRWVMGPTNDGWTFSGWNIDDVVLLGLQDRGPGGTLETSTMLDPLRPNPVLGAAEITYRLPGPDQVTLAVYDLAGRRVASMDRGYQMQGSHTFTWNVSGPGGERLPSGVYIVRVEACGSSDVRKVVVLR